MRKKTKLVYGVGINDADYVVNVRETIGYDKEGKQIQKSLWRCPFYTTWVNMLKRCYNQSYKKNFPSYNECSVLPEWHYFTNFRVWMAEQGWQDKSLDKDLLFPRNKLYSPDTCIFISNKVNTFITESNAARGEWPIGVDFKKYLKRFRAQCNDINIDKISHLGCFDTPEEAHQAWLAFKLQQAYILAAEQTDPRVAAALINRYENYAKYFSQPT